MAFPPPYLRRWIRSPRDGYRTFCLGLFDCACRLSLSLSLPLDRDTYDCVEQVQRVFLTLTFTLCTDQKKKKAPGPYLQTLLLHPSYSLCPFPFPFPPVPAGIAPLLKKTQAPRNPAKKKTIAVAYASIIRAAVLDALCIFLTSPSIKLIQRKRSRKVLPIKVPAQLPGLWLDGVSGVVPGDGRLTPVPRP